MSGQRASHTQTDTCLTIVVSIECERNARQCSAVGLGDAALQHPSFDHHDGLLMNFNYHHHHAAADGEDGKLDAAKEPTKV